MANKVKINLKDKLDENELDLSLMELTDVPVKDIAALSRVNSLLLSNNRLLTLPANFATLTNLVKLDLSKNMLKELPENFGMLTKLQSLDLYSNKLERLPLSFADLKNLRWLDLKDNPLVPSLAAEAGDCLDMKGCQLAAKRVVQLMTIARTEYEKRRQKEIQEVGAREAAQKSEEEKQQEKQRQEKKAAKQQRKAQTKNQANQKSSPPEKEKAKIEAPKKPVTEIRAPTNPSRDRGPSIWMRLAYWFFVLLLISTLSFLSFAFWSHKGAFDLPNIQKSLAKTGKIVQEKLASLDRKFLGKLVTWTIDYSNLARQKFIEGLSFALALLEEIGSVCAVVFGRYLEILKREGPSSFRFVIDALYAFGETCHNLWVVVVDNIKRTIAD